MAVSTTTDRIEYDLDGVTAGYAVPFQFLDADHLIVTWGPEGTETTLTRGADYTVGTRPADLPATGTITLLSPASLTGVMRIRRYTPRTQALTQAQNGAISAAAQIRAWDRDMLIEQEQDASSGDVIATEFIHGIQPGGNLHATVVRGGAAGFMDGTVLDTILDHVEDVTTPVGFNVKDYGAIGDGITDDTDRIQDAIDAASVLGGVVFFPPGTYLVSNAVSSGTIFTLVNPNVTLSGSGRKASIVKSSSAMTAGHVVFLVSSTSHVVFEDLGVQGSAAAASSAGIAFSAATDCTVQRVWADSQFGWSVFIENGCSRTIVRDLVSAGSSSNNIEINASSYTLVEGCDLAGTGGSSNAIELYENGGSGIVGNTIRNNWIHGARSSGIASYGTISTLIDGNVVEDSTTAGIYVTNSEATPATSGGGVVVRGNRVRNTTAGGGGAGILVAASQSGGLGPTDVVLEANHVTGSAGSIPGIYITAPDMRAVLIGNVCTFNGGEGILANSGHASIIGNICMNNSQVGVGLRAGISIIAGIPDAVIIGNECSDTQTSHTQVYGVVVNNTATDAVVIGNKAYGTTSYGIIEGGTRTVMLGNTQNASGVTSIPNQFPAAPTALARTTVTYSASMAINAWLGNEFVITATDGVNFAIVNPTNPTVGQRITLRIINTSGGALGTVSWGTAYKMAAWTSPATANSRAIDFQYDGVVWKEVSRTSADVPN